METHILRNNVPVSWDCGTLWIYVIVYRYASEFCSWPCSSPMVIGLPSFLSFIFSLFLVCFCLLALETGSYSFSCFETHDPRLSLPYAEIAVVGHHASFCTQCLPEHLPNLRVFVVGIENRKYSPAPVYVWEREREREGASAAEVDISCLSVFSLWDRVSLNLGLAALCLEHHQIVVSSTDTTVPCCHTYLWGGRQGSEGRWGSCLSMESSLHHWVIFPDFLFYFVWGRASCNLILLCNSGWLQLLILPLLPFKKWVTVTYYHARLEDGNL